MKNQFSQKIYISKNEISSQSRTYIIAEAGVNHNGDMDLAKKMIDVAMAAGVDAVKFQAFKSEELILRNVDKASYQQQTTGKEQTQFEMLKKLEVQMDQFKLLKDYCNKIGITFLVTPFDDKSLDELDQLNIDAYKIASTDLTNLPFLKRVAQKNKPIILSTGMSYFSEVEQALEEIWSINKDVILLHCTANYPVPNSEVNLNVLNTYKERFSILLGYSDHTVGIGASPYSLAYGAKVVEKHFTLDKDMDGPDQEASLSPDELSEYVKEIRRVEVYMGSSIKSPQISELNTRKSLQKCFVASCDIKEGEIFGDNNITAKRTGGVGISPIYYKNVFGKKSSQNYFKNDIIKL